MTVLVRQVIKMSLELSVTLIICAVFVFGVFTGFAVADPIRIEININVRRKTTEEMEVTP